MSKEIVVNRVDDKIVIEMPIDTLKFACENHPNYPLTVMNDDEFAKYIVDYILHFNENESGNSAFQRLLDELFQEYYQDGGPLASQDDVYPDDYE